MSLVKILPGFAPSLLASGVRDLSQLICSFHVKNIFFTEIKANTMEEQLHENLARSDPTTEKQLYEPIVNDNLKTKKSPGKMEPRMELTTKTLTLELPLDRNSTMDDFYATSLEQSHQTLTHLQLIGAAVGIIAIIILLCTCCIVFLGVRNSLIFTLKSQKCMSTFLG